MKRANSYKGTGINLLVIFLIVVVIYFATQRYTSTVTGVSMEPTLETGDMVILQRIPFGQIRVGDIVVYNQPSSVGSGCIDFQVIHRVVGIAPDGGLITQGDNRRTNPQPDEPFRWPYVHENCVRGHVVFAIPYIGRLSYLFPPPINYILVGALILLVVFSEIMGRGGEIGESKEEEREVA